jgi:hypothetical protein
MEALLIVGLFVVLLAGILWSVYGPPKERCGLRKGARYRVERSFTSGNSEFREGEIVIFKLQRRNCPWFAANPHTEDPDGPEEDLYHFVEAGSKKPKTISSEMYPTVNEWLQFLEEVRE